ncbi:MAG: hypothetical protein QME87_10115 [Bacillota bacterium]|nr:hypothetical protein [Bacillota bacterium]
MSVNRLRRYLVAAAAMAAALLLLARPCLARYTWNGDEYSYFDVRSSDPNKKWLVPYTESMRRARVVVGYYVRHTMCDPYGCWSQWDYYFYPDSTASRAWWGMCLMEVLGTLEDYSYRIGNTDWYWDNRRWFRPYANDMLAAGLIPWQTFQDGSIRRDEAFSWSVRALGLRPVAEMMSESEVNYYLNQFPDGRYTDPRYRADMALSIKLGLARGYDDGYLHPGDYLLRSSGAVLASRVLAVVLQVSPEVFRPQDGQTVTFCARTCGVGSVRSWKLELGPASGSWSVLRSWSGWSLPPTLAVWNGRDSSGALCAPGVYLARLSGDYETVVGEVIGYQVVRHVVIDGRSLAGRVDAASWKRGSSVPVSFTVNGVQKTPVTVRGDWGTSVEIPVGQTSGLLSIPADVPGGTHAVTFECVLGQAGCQDAAFTSRAQFVVDARSFSAELGGSQFRAGSLVPFSLQVSGAVQGAVKCRGSWAQEWELGPGDTSGYFLLPSWAQVGDAWVEFEAVLSQAGCPDETFRSRVGLVVLPAGSAGVVEVPSPPPEGDIPDWWTPPWQRGWQ